MLRRELRSTRELLMVYAGILAHGTALSATETARMIPQLSSAAVRQAMKWASDDATISSVQQPQRSESGAHLTEN
jgi:Tn3 transposase DDE domain